MRCDVCFVMATKEWRVLSVMGDGKVVLFLVMLCLGMATKVWCGVSLATGDGGG